MIDIEQALHELRGNIEYPPTPDMAERVVSSITQQPQRHRGWGPIIRRVGIVVATIVVIVALIPSARDQVAAWLGLRGATIIEQPFDSLPGRLDLGEAMSLAEAAALAGFDPLIPAVLGSPDSVFVENGRIWMLYAETVDLPETAVPGIGAVIAQFPTGEIPGFAKSVAAGATDIVEFDGGFGIWIDGPHELVLSSPSDQPEAGRSAGSTLLWETDTLTIRMEIAVPRAAAIDVARTFR